ncbi:MAG: hypothetical protein JO057_08345 [Chloroflexi bacterium]|nr:hypothetical protein [Chloroflexota bacterium]
MTASLPNTHEASSFDRAQPARTRLLVWAERTFGVALALPLMAWGLIGGYSRYTADDFCWAGVLRADGFVNANVHYYVDYSPRFTFTFLVNVTELIGPAIVPALPITAIVVWLGALTWTFVQFGTPVVRGLILAELAVVATLQTAPDLPQSFYWQTGLLTYFLPLIMATLLLGWVRLGIQRWWAWGLSALIAFLAGGLSETYLIPQNVALTVALLLALVFGTRRVHLLAALAGGVLALVVIVVAPATAGRVMGTPADLRLTLLASIATAYFQVVRLVRFFPFTVLLCLSVPTLISSGVPRVSGRWFLLVTACVLIMLPFAYFPSFYAQNGNPPARSLIVPGALLVGYLVFAGFALRGVLSPVLSASPGVAGVALLGLSLVPVVAAITILPEQSTAAQYAALFDAEDQQIRASRAAGQTDLTVPPLPTNFGENFISGDRGNWFNQCVARYYDLSSIAAS